MFGRYTLVFALLGALFSLRAQEFAVAEEIDDGLPTIIDSPIPAPLCFQINETGDYVPVGEFTTLPRGTKVVFALPLSALPANLHNAEIGFNRGDWSLGKARWIPERQRWEIAVEVGATLQHVSLVDPAAVAGNFDGAWTGEGTPYARPPGWEFYNSFRRSGAWTGDYGIYFNYDGDEIVSLAKSGGGYSGGSCLRLENKLPVYAKDLFDAGANLSGYSSWCDNTSSTDQSTWQLKPVLNFNNFGGRIWSFIPYAELDHLYARIRLKAKPVSNGIVSTLNIGTRWKVWMSCQSSGGRVVDGTDWREYSFAGKLRRASSLDPSGKSSGEVVNIAPSYRGGAWLLDDVEIRAIRPEGAYYFQVKPSDGSAMVSSAMFLAGNRMSAEDEVPVRPAHFYGQSRPVEFVDSRSQTTGAMPALLLPTGAADLAPYLVTNNAPELRDHYLLDQLIEKYNHDPLALANFVYNEIGLTDPYGYNGDSVDPEGSYSIWGDGLSRSALGTYVEGRGSPIEQCSLLVYLLRKCGVPAAYAWTTDENGLKLSREYVSMLIGTDLTELLGYRDSANKMVSVRYPWVVAYVPRANGGYDPVRLFPWMKDLELRQGLNIWNYLPQALSTGRKINEYFFRHGDDFGISLTKSDVPTDLLPNFLQQKIKEQYPQLALADFGINRIERKHYFSSWDAFPAPQLTDMQVVLWPDLRQDGGLWYNIAQIDVVDRNNAGNKLTTGRMPYCDLQNRRIYVERNFAGAANSFMLYLGPIDYSREKIARGGVAHLAPMYYGSLSAGYNFSANPNDGTLVSKIGYSNSGILSASAINVFVKTESSRFAATRRLASSAEFTYVSGTTRSIDNVVWRNLSNRNRLDGFLNVTSFNGFPYESIDLEWQADKYRNHISINASTGSAAMTGLAMGEYRYFESIKGGFSEQSTPAPSSENAFYCAWRDGVVGHVLSRFYGHRMRTATDFVYQLSNAASLYPGNWTVGVFGYATLGTTLYPGVDIRYAAVWEGFAKTNGIGRHNYPGLAGLEYDRRDMVNALDLAWLQGSAAEHDVIRQLFQSDDVVSTVSLLQRAVAEPDNAVVTLTYSNYRNYQAMISHFSTSTWNEIDAVLKASPDTVIFIPQRSIQTQAWANYGWWEQAASGSFGAYILHTDGNRSTAPVVNAPVLVGLTEDAGSPTINGGSGPLQNPAQVKKKLDTVAPESSTANSTGVAGDVTGAEEQQKAIAEGSASEDYMQALDKAKAAADMAVATALEAAQKIKEVGEFNDGAQTTINKQDAANDPVDITTGALHVAENDISLDGPIPLTFGRNYSSFNIQTSAFGYGWSFSLKPYLVDITDNEERFYVALPNGNEYIFRRLANSTTEWRAQPDDNVDAFNSNGDLFASNIFDARLVKGIGVSGTTLYTLTLQNGYRLIYESAQFPIKKSDGTTYVTRDRPYLRVIEDPLGNRLQLFYYGDRLIRPAGDPNGYTLRPDGWIAYEFVPSTDPICLTNAYGQVRLIRATNGQFASFTYTENGFLESVRTGDGRTVRYKYDGYGDLRSVTRLDGTLQTFEYVLAPTGDFSTHLLRRVDTPDGRTLINAYPNTDSAAYAAYDNRSEYSAPTATPTDESYFEQANRRVLQQWMTSGSNLLPVRNATYSYIDTDSDGAIDLTQVYDVFNQPSPNPANDSYASPEGYRPTTYRHHKGMITSITDTLGQNVTQEWYETTDTPNGAYAKSMKRRVDKRGLETTYRYDAAGRVVEQTTTGKLIGAPGETTSTRTTQTWYNANSLPLVVRTTDVALVGGDSPADIVTSYTYNGYVSGGVTIGAGFLADTSTTRVGATVTTDGNGLPVVTGGTVVSYRQLEFESQSVTADSLYGTASSQGLLSRTRVAGSDSPGSAAYYTAFVNTPQSFVSEVRSLALAGTVGGAPATDVADHVQTMDYNIRGELVSETEGTRFRRTATYDPYGRPQRVETYGLSGSTEQLMASRSTYYTDNGEAAWTDGPLAGAAEDYVFADYDGAGRVIAQVVWRSEAKTDGSGVQQISDASVALAPMALTRYIYDGFGNCVKVIDAEGNYTRKSHDAIGQLLREEYFEAVTNRSLGWVAYDYQTAPGQYEGGGQPVTITTSGGVVTRYTYTQEGKKLSQIAPDGSVTRWTYHLDGRVHTQTLPNGTTLTSSYDDTAYTATVVTKDKAGNLICTDFTRTDFRGLTVEQSHTEAGQTAVTATTEYDALGRPVLSTGSAGATATATTGGSVTTTQAYRYAADGSWSLVATPATFSGASVTGYEVTVQQIDALDRTTSVKTYYVTGSIPNAPPTGTPLEQVSYTYDPDHHYVTETRGDPAASGHRTRTTTYTDTLGKPVLTRLYSSDTQVEATTRVIYDRLGRAIQTIEPPKATSVTTTTPARITTMAYDGLGRPTLTRLPDGAETRLIYDTGGHLIARLMPGGLRWQAGYDNAGRKTWEQLLGSDGSPTRRFRFDYYSATSAAPGQPLRVTDDLRGISSYYDAYDPRGRLLIESTSIDKTRSPNIAAYRRTYTYGGLNGSLQEVGLSYPGGEHPATTVASTQDASGQVLREVTTLAGADYADWSQSWDGAGRRTALQLAGATSWAYGYGYTYPGGTQRAVTYQLGGQSRTVAYDGLGAVSATSGSGVFASTQSYDWRGRLTLQEHTYAGSGSPLAHYKQTLAYNLDGALRQLARTALGTGATALTQTYTYNPRGQLTKEVIGSRTHNYAFDTAKLGVRTGYDGPGDSASQPDRRSLGGDFDAYGRTTSEGVAPQPVAIAGTVQNVAGVELQVSEQTAGSTWTAASAPLIGTAGTPDTGGTAPWSLSVYLAAGTYKVDAYARDPVLGRLPQPLASRQFTVTPGSPYAGSQVIDSEYDGAGVLLRRLRADGTVQTFYWDALGHLLRVTDLNPSGTGTQWSAHYDAVGRRLRTFVAPVAVGLVGAVTHTTSSWFDPSVRNLELGASRTGTGIAYERFWKLHAADLNGSYGGLLGIGGLEGVAREAGDGTLGDWTWLEDDALGNLLGTARQTGGTWAYTASTKVITAYGPANPATAAAASWTTTAATDLAAATFWRGYRIDPTGFYWMGARYYDPAGGRFISPDPLGHAECPDLYSFCNGDPVNRVDPTGMGAAAQQKPSATGVNATSKGSEQPKDWNWFQRTFVADTREQSEDFNENPDEYRVVSALATFSGVDYKTAKKAYASMGSTNSVDIGGMIAPNSGGLQPTKGDYAAVMAIGWGGRFGAMGSDDLRAGADQAVIEYIVLRGIEPTEGLYRFSAGGKAGGEITAATVVAFGAMAGLRGQAQASPSRQLPFGFSRFLEQVELTKSVFGHTFEKHGQYANEFVLRRAQGSGIPSGQFLDNQAAAQFILRNLDKLNNGAVSLPVPPGFPARIVNPDGSFSAPNSIRLVPGGRGVDTAYPDVLKVP